MAAPIANGTSSHPNGELHTKQQEPSEAHGAPLPARIPSFRQLLAESAKEHSDRVAFISMYQPSDLFPIKFPYGKISSSAGGNGGYLRLTHGQLQHAAEILALGLRQQGVRKGEPIATLLYNCAEWVILLRAAAILRCPFVSLNARGTANAKEVEHMLKTSKSRVLIAADTQIATKLQETLPEVINSLSLRVVLEADNNTPLPSWVVFKEVLQSAPTDKSGLELDVHVPGEDEEVALIIFTSGTTSLPKGGIHTNKSLSSALISQGIALKLNEQSRTCCHMPVHHIGGIGIAYGFMIVGGSTVFPSKSFDPASSLDAMSREQCTNLPCVPAILQALAGHPKLKTTDLSSLRNVEMGATTILLEHFRLVATAIGCASVTNAFAATEALPMTLAFFDTKTVKSVNVGHMCPGARVRICEPDSRNVVPRGKPGELHLGGPMVIRGYLEGASPHSFYEDDQGWWFVSGDQGIMSEDGIFNISGRYKDLIIRGGENIAPASIEAVLDSQLKLTSQVIGVRSEEAGEVPVAVIQVKEDTPDQTLAIQKAVVGALGPGFVPETVYTLKDLDLPDYPRTSSGKVRKIELKAIVQKHIDALETVEPVKRASDPASFEKELSRLWHKIIGVDVSALDPATPISELADSLTIMRFRNTIKRELGIDVSTGEITEAGTIKKQATLLSSKNGISTTRFTIDIQREGPPSTSDIAIALGQPDIASQIQKDVTDALTPYGFTWEDDVEDVIPSWDLGYEVFGSVVGTAKVNHRISLSTKKCNTAELLEAIRTVVKHHSMHRSFELRGLNGEPTMRVIMRPNEKWFQYSIEEIPEVEHPDDLVKLIEDGTHFSEVEHPFPSFLVRIAQIKSTNTAGVIWALQHSAFDGLALYSFLEDLDALLLSPSSTVQPHIPYKLWADMYYLHRTSLSSTRSVARQVQRLSGLSSIIPSLFPPPPKSSGLKSAALATQRKTFIAPVKFVTLPHLASLRTTHEITPFILIKAALALFLSRKTTTEIAAFSQNENGRSWPFVEPWLQDVLPDCMDLAGPTLERTVQLIKMPSSTSTTVLSFLKSLKKTQEEESEDVHAPWNLVRAGLPGGDKDKVLFDAVAMSTCLNYLPVRTKNGKVVFEAMEYHETKANCETAWLFNCGIEGEGKETKMWTQIMIDEDLVSRDSALSWTKDVMDITAWLCDKSHWEVGVHQYATTK